MSLRRFRTPVAMSDAGIWALQFDALPDDVGGLAKILQGLLIHEHMPDFYGVALSDRQRGEPHVRGAGQILERIAVHDPRPLAHARFRHASCGVAWLIAPLRYNAPRISTCAMIRSTRQLKSRGRA